MTIKLPPGCSRKTRDAYERLFALYDMIQDLTSPMECIAKCADCCGPIQMIRLERNLQKVKYNTLASSRCPYLGKDHRCAIYETRPFVCRIFGNTSAHTRLICPRGCGPDHKIDAETLEWMQKEYKELSEL